MPLTQGDDVQDLADIGLTYDVREDFKSRPWIFVVISPVKENDLSNSISSNQNRSNG